MPSMLWGQRLSDRHPCCSVAARGSSVQGCRNRHRQVNMMQRAADSDHCWRCAAATCRRCSARVPCCTNAAALSASRGSLCRAICSALGIADCLRMDRLHATAPLLSRAAAAVLTSSYGLMGVVPKPGSIRLANWHHGMDNQGHVRPSSACIGTLRSLHKKLSATADRDAALRFAPSSQNLGKPLSVPAQLLQCRLAETQNKNSAAQCCCSARLQNAEIVSTGLQVRAAATSSRSECA